MPILHIDKLRRVGGEASNVSGPYHRLYRCRNVRTGKIFLEGRSDDGGAVEAVTKRIAPYMITRWRESVPCAVRRRPLLCCASIRSRAGALGAGSASAAAGSRRNSNHAPSGVLLPAAGRPAP